MVAGRGRFTRTQNAGHIHLNTVQDCGPGHANERSPSCTSLEKPAEKNVKDEILIAVNNKPD
ncbi:hypothetical protein DPMN_156552 [Dreissena polymorpha]|uniref:Uncharacterized protein n=1 Tax=Dreissena polymorpha TaxID=45954 RepID=A0A9D4FQX4_DREPO|nr:hypothetical protein DPMN_156552 [Dreissena polymorpha]